jgi:DNA-binding transcriptional LysR family regulator
MEMHQVRYFLTVAHTLNFTRAAEQCNVSQPALTRAIRQLEEEFGGELLRREGKLSHLTELGRRMLPLMRQCYDSALAAKSLATSLKKGAANPLSLGLSHTIDMRLLTPMLAELQRAVAGLQLRVVRGNAGEIGEALQKGRVEFAVAGPLAQTWDRLEAWPLFDERFELLVHRDHPLAGAEAVDAGKLSGQRLLISEQCEQADSLARMLNERGVAGGAGHKLDSLDDVVALVAAGLGVALLPQSAGRREQVRRIAVADLDLARKVSLYGVAGRQRSTGGDALMKLLRARAWSARPHA